MTTDEQTQLQIEQFVRRRHGCDVEEFKRAVARETVEFELGLLRFDRVEWLLEGLGALAWSGLALDLSVPRRTMDALHEALDEAIAEQAESAPEDRFAPELVDTTRAWLRQTDYELWTRVRDFRSALVDVLDESLSTFATRGGPDMNAHGAKAWERLVLEWYDLQ